MGCSVVVDKVYYRYPKETDNTLHGVSLTVQTGDFYGLLGPNGAGKTTLISALVGILSPESGTIRYQSADGQFVPTSFLQQIGFVPQEYAFYPELTMRQNLAYFGALYNVSDHLLHIRIQELAEVLGLTNVLDKKVHGFSGGMKRRLNIAIGILHGVVVV